MADVSITSLTALGGAPATDDELVIVDVSDHTQAPTGTTKNMTVANLFTAPHLTSVVVDSGGLTVTAGDLTVTAGSASIGSNAMFSTAGLAKGNLAGVRTTGVSTSPTAIAFSEDVGAFSIVTGSDGAGNKFTDLVFWSGTTANVISAISLSGLPVARTYTSAGAFTLNLEMASSAGPDVPYTIYAVTVNVSATVA